jgi:hypothetical protein
LSTSGEIEREFTPSVKTEGKADVFELVASASQPPFI